MVIFQQQPPPPPMPQYNGQRLDREIEVTSSISFNPFSQADKSPTPVQIV